MATLEILPRRLNPSFSCWRCARTLPILRPARRSLTTSTTLPAKGYAQLRSRRIITLKGPDASKYLQGAITQNITKQHSGFYAAFLTAQGRVLHDVFIYPVGEPYKDEAGNAAFEQFFVEIDANYAEQFAKHIKKYKLRAKFDVKAVDADKMSVWSLWDERPQSEGAWTGYKMDSREGQHISYGKVKEGSVDCVDGRAPGMGKRLLLPGGIKPEFDAEEVDEEVYKIRRYLKGVPEGQDELIRGTALPQQSNIDYMGGIDYRKGCYVGQELTIRTHHTGVIRKRILPIQLYGEEEEKPTTMEYDGSKQIPLPPAGTSIDGPDRKTKGAGQFLAGIGNIGLGLCRLEKWNAPNEEFVAQWGEGDAAQKVKAQAFQPSWHLPA